mgnify:FL=1
MLRKIGTFIVLPVFIVTFVLIYMAKEEPDGLTSQPVSYPPVTVQKKAKEQGLPTVGQADPELIWGVEPEYRKDVAVMIDRMRATIPVCNEFMDEGLVTWMNRDVATANPEFSAWCGRDRKSKRYFFTWMDIVNKQPAYQRTTIPRYSAVRACKDKSEPSVKYPETLKFRNVAYHDNQDGTARVAMTMVASNAFGVPVSHEVRCVFSGDLLKIHEVF